MEWSWLILKKNRKFKNSWDNSFFLCKILLPLIFFKVWHFFSPNQIALGWFFGINKCTIQNTNGILKVMHVQHRFVECLRINSSLYLMILTKSDAYITWVCWKFEHFFKHNSKRCLMNLFSFFAKQEKYIKS